MHCLNLNVEFFKRRRHQNSMQSLASNGPDEHFKHVSRVLFRVAKNKENCIPYHKQGTVGQIYQKYNKFFCFAFHKIICTKNVAVSKYL